MCTFLSGPPHTRTTPPQLMSLQEVQVLLIPQCTAKTDSKNSIAIKSYAYIHPIIWEGPWEGGLKLPIMAISSLWHRMRPFQRLKMIPGSVSISRVRRFVLAAQFCPILSPQNIPRSPAISPIFSCLIRQLWVKFWQK